ncbi:MAG TPA: AbrB/MazE/SpoVT family DNA-binding domain-containing protein [Verrucomicrobiae bacterium]|jgi:AbrB family looped-hinge helix DNA binding protein|nr:AbrB/MazE/SpoVT family DNA-binding domain-containing protein [Verrucomicrobiae bacterium]
MRTKVSTKGQVVLPSRVRHRLGLQPGDSLGVELEGGRIILTPRKARTRKARIIKDPLTGFPVLTFGKGAAPLTSQQVKDILADFP